MAPLWRECRPDLPRRTTAAQRRTLTLVHIIRMHDAAALTWMLHTALRGPTHESNPLVWETTTMNALQSTDNAQEPRSETLDNKATYRAPRLVSLGTAAGLVQAYREGNIFDSPAGNFRMFRR